MWLYLLKFKSNFVFLVISWNFEVLQKTNLTRGSKYSKVMEEVNSNGELWEIT